MVAGISDAYQSYRLDGYSFLRHVYVVGIGIFKNASGLGIRLLWTWIRMWLLVRRLVDRPIWEFQGTGIESYARNTVIPDTSVVSYLRVISSYDIYANPRCGHL